MKMNELGARPTSDAERFAAVHAGQPSTAFAANLHTSVTLLRSGGLTLPATVNDGAASEADSAWVCSPFTTYGPYAAQESVRHLPRWLGAPVSLACAGYGSALRRAHIDRAVALNNWLLSTNLYPALPPGEALRDCIAGARLQWPGHALWLRSLNTAQNADWLAALQALGFVLLPSRRVYLFAQLGRPGGQHQNLARDLALLRRTALTRVSGTDFTAADFDRAAALYAALYTDKYSRFNPQYNAHFIARWHAAGLLRLTGFRDARGVLQAVVGTFGQGDTLTAPLVGYNTALPAALGLYRLLMACVFDEAMRSGRMLNLSAGAAGFKRLRGGEAVTEYSAVLAGHMPAPTRFAVGVLKCVATQVGLPLMKRFQL